MSWLRDVDVTVFPNGECGAMSSEMDESMLCAGEFAGRKVFFSYYQGGETCLFCKKLLAKKQV